jgi:hypothetical protein
MGNLLSSMGIATTKEIEELKQDNASKDQRINTLEVRDQQKDQKITSLELQDQHKNQEIDNLKSKIKKYERNTKDKLDFLENLLNTLYQTLNDVGTLFLEQNQRLEQKIQSLEIKIKSLNSEHETIKNDKKINIQIHLSFIDIHLESLIKHIEDLKIEKDLVEKRRILSNIALTIAKFIQDFNFLRADLATTEHTEDFKRIQAITDFPENEERKNSIKKVLSEFFIPNDVHKIMLSIG